MLVSTTIAVALSLVATAGASDCTSTTTADVSLALESAEARYADLDVDGFRTAMDQAAGALPCMTDPVPRHLAAWYHRMIGLRGFVERDPVSSTKAFVAARSIQPGYRFPESMIPAGNPVLTDYETISLDSGTFVTVAAPSEGHLQFDGRAGSERPQSWPTLVQVFDGAGSVHTTAYLWPADPMVIYDAIATADPRPGVPDVDGSSDAAPLEDPGSGTVSGPPPRLHRARTPLLASSVGFGAAAGALYLVAALSHNRYENTVFDPADETTFATLDPHRKRTNALVGASIATGSIAAGLGLTAVFVAHW